MIYFDPSESRAGTRLPTSVVEKGKSVTGLEDATGADLLITAWDGVLRGGMLGKPPLSIMLGKALESGMLIQRKSGMDMLGSIPHLGHIFQRMQMASEEYGTPLWLAYTGRFYPNLMKNVECNDRDSDWHWNAFQGALDMWSLRGGMVHWESDDEMLGEWILRWDEKLPKLLNDPDIVLSPRPKSRLTGGTIDPAPWRRTLESFPGVGSVLSNRISQRTGSLADAIWWMSHTELFDIQGVGEKMSDSWRKWFGLPEGWCLCPVPINDPITENLRKKDGEIQQGSDDNTSP